MTEGLGVRAFEYGTTVMMPLTSPPPVMKRSRLGICGGGAVTLTNILTCPRLSAGADLIKQRLLSHERWNSTQTFRAGTDLPSFFDRGRSGNSMLRAAKRNLGLTISGMKCKLN